MHRIKISIDVQNEELVLLLFLLLFILSFSWYIFSISSSSSLSLLLSKTLPFKSLKDLCVFVSLWFYCFIVLFFTLLTYRDDFWQYCAFALAQGFLNSCSPLPQNQRGSFRGLFFLRILLMDFSLGTLLRRNSDSTLAVRIEPICQSFCQILS